MARKPARAHDDSRDHLAPTRLHTPRRARTELEFEEATILGALFGQFDANLVQIENRLGVYISARGNRAQIEGPEDAVARARDVLEAKNKAALDAARALGAEDSLIEFEGLTPQMVEALAKDDVKTLEDFATCADWELAGGWTTVNGARVKDEGLLEPYGVTLEDAQTMVMTARVMLGWVDPTELDDTDAEDDLQDDDDNEEAGA